MNRLVIALITALFLLFSTLGITLMLSALAPILSATESTCCVFLSPESLTLVAEKVHVGLIVAVGGMLFAGFCLGVVTATWGDR